jgi:hypothetical protein
MRRPSWLLENLHTQWDFSQKWLRTFGGRTWFFLADFDPATNSIINVQVNSPK